VYVGQEFEGGKKKTEEKTRQDFRSGQFRWISKLRKIERTSRMTFTMISFFRSQHAARL
jgi:hypothetical protein